MVRHYKFAGVEICVDISDERIYQDSYRLKKFEILKGNDPNIYKFTLKNTLDKPQGIFIGKNPGDCLYQDGSRRIRYVGSVWQTLDGAYIRIASEGTMHEVQLLSAVYPEHIGVKTVLNALDVTHLIAQKQGFILHCSYIERNGRAILFTAPSGTGKSTQAELWKKLRNAEIINGDRAAVRIVDGTATAEGIPFSGSSSYCENRSLPIEAIVYLKQASQTDICELHGYQAFSRLWEGITLNFWDKKDVEIVSEAVRKVAEETPIYQLCCTPDETAVTALEQALRKKGHS